MYTPFDKILVIRTDRIGDVVLTIPALNALRMHYPNAHIALMVAPQIKDLVEGLASIDEVIVDDRKGVHKGWGYFRLISDLRRHRFDLAINYHTKRRTNLACFLAGIPYRTGFKNNKFGFLLTHPVFDTRHKGIKHESEYCLDVIGALGVHATGLEIDLPVQEENVHWVEEFCIDQGISNDEKLFIFHPGASDPSKCWPIGHFTDLIDQLVAKYGCRTVIIGDMKTKSAAQQIIERSSSEILDLTGQTSVGKLTALLSRGSLLVSNDSGPVHIAAGVGTPVVSIFTRNQPGINPERWRPLGSLSRTVSVTPAQSKDLNFKKAHALNADYAELVAVSEVLEEVDSLFKLC